MENQPGIFSIMRENELRVDDRKHHKGMAYYPLRHYHGVSIFLEVHAAQKSLDEMFHGFSIDLKPYYDKTQMEKIPYECCSQSVNGRFQSRDSRNCIENGIRKSRKIFIRI